MISDRAALRATALIAGVLVLGMVAEALTGRYSIESVGSGAVWQLDHWNGWVRFCTPNGCMEWWGPYSPSGTYNK